MTVTPWATALAGVLVVGTQAAAQAPEYRMRAIHTHPHQATVASAVRFHAGSQDDEETREGTAWLLGRVLEAQAVRALARAGSEATVSVSVGRATTLVTVLAFQERWQEAWAAVDSVVFDAALDPAVVEAQHAALARRITFEAGSPVQDFETEAAALLSDPGSPYARPRRGTAASLATLTRGDLARYRDTHVRRSLAVQAVVGPASPDVVTLDTVPQDTVAADTVPRGTMPQDTVAAPGPTGPPPAPPRRMAWLVGDRRTQVQDVTSTWIEVAYPVPWDLPRTRLELIVHLLKEELDPTPPAPDRFSVEVRLEETPGGPVLVVEAAVFPEATARWEERITGAVRRLAERPIPEDFFRWRRRRFRTARLLEEAAPEAEAARMTADLLRDGVVRDLGLEIWALDPASVGETAGALGDPRIFILGPDLGGARSRNDGTNGPGSAGIVHSVTRTGG